MLCYKGIEDTVAWFQKAKPEPTSKDLSTQIGVHLEEVAEFIDALSIDTNKDSGKAIYEHAQATLDSVQGLAKLFKEHDVVRIMKNDRIEVLDGLADQIVTAVGVACYANMNIIAGLNEVNRSNFSKFASNGTPVIDSNRKIIKGPNYSKPDLSQMV